MNTSTMEVPTEATTSNPLPDLDGHDRCDHGGCNAQAYVRVQLPTGGADLLFCGHDYSKHEAALAERGARVRDERQRLTVTYSDVEATELTS